MTTQQQTNEMIAAAVRRVRSAWLECRIPQLLAEAAAIEAEIISLERRIRHDLETRKRVAKLWEGQ